MQISALDDSHKKSLKQLSVNRCSIINSNNNDLSNSGSDDNDEGCRADKNNNNNKNKNDNNDNGRNENVNGDDDNDNNDCNGSSSNDIQSEIIDYNYEKSDNSGIENGNDDCVNENDNTSHEENADALIKSDKIKQSDLQSILTNNDGEQGTGPRSSCRGPALGYVKTQRDDTGREDRGDKKWSDADQAMFSKVSEVYKECW